MHRFARAVLLVSMALAACEEETAREVIVVRPSGVSPRATQLRITVSIDGGPTSIPELFPPDRTQLHLLLPGTAPGRVAVQLDVMDCHRCVMSRGLAQVDVIGAGRYDVVIPVQALMPGECAHQPEGKLHVPRWHHRAVRLARGPHAGKVLIVGGATVNDLSPPPGEQSFPSQLEIYDPGDATSRLSAATLAGGRWAAVLAPLPDGRYLIAGGFDGTGPLARVEIYDPDADRIVAAAPMRVARSNFAGAPLGDGRVLVTGGSGVSGGLASAELYDPAADRWSAVDDMLLARRHHAAVTLPDGRVMVTGGIVEIDEARLVEVFVPATPRGLQWSYGGTLGDGHAFHTATVLADGRVLVAGGFESQFMPLDAAELWNGSDEWRRLGGLAFARGRHTATLLADGRVAVAGGGSDDIVPVADVYDPVRGMTVFTLPLAVARTEHTATLLEEGTLLLTGGVGNPGIGSTKNGPVLDSIERLVPAACP